MLRAGGGGKAGAEGAYWARLYDLLQGQVHPRVAVDQVSIEGLAVLQLDEHGVALGGIEQP